MTEAKKWLIAYAKGKPIDMLIDGGKHMNNTDHIAQALEDYAKSQLEKVMKENKELLTQISHQSDCIQDVEAERERLEAEMNKGLIDIRTDIIEGANGGHVVEFSIEQQTFRLQEVYGGGPREMTSHEHAQWYETQLRYALSKLEMEEELKRILSEIRLDHTVLGDISDKSKNKLLKLLGRLT